ncbi:hypothetical protein L3476_27325 [Paenibacillus thiaminolyticus]|uniref:hypothetical protein n=1 Tax=Paenibacillus thiaminolyticus TaxID=49283 RepID=UPI00234FB940|nr:hypothetical protein [Paenibacillus thiaminolyticus]WCR26858.1 hypothetical protein L3476_27325 [Paenibacillus thiaminolyticus]
MNLIHHTPDVRPGRINLLPVRPRLERRFPLYFGVSGGLLLVAVAALAFATWQYRAETVRIETEMSRLRSEIMEARAQKEPDPATLIYQQLEGQSWQLREERRDWEGMWRRWTEGLPGTMRWKRAAVEADNSADMVHMSFVTSNADDAAAYEARLQAMDGVKEVRFQQWSGDTEPLPAGQPLLEVDYTIILEPRVTKEAAK